MNSNFDFVVLGTGVVEAAVAAALARAGKTVCHLDRQEFYGGRGAALPLIDFLHLLLTDSETFENVVVDITGGDLPEEDSGDNDKIEDYSDFLSGLQRDSKEYHVARQLCGGDLTASIPRSTLKRAHELFELFQQSRKFLLELSSKLLFCGGEVVKELIKSNIGHYLEFRCVETISMLWDGKLELVPGSKEDVFKNDSLTLVEKRKLMKFLSVTPSSTKGEDVSADGGYDENGLFHDYLNTTGLSERLKSVIFNAIGLFSAAEDVNKVTVADGLIAVKRYMDSLGRYGSTGFLYGIYGTSSELSQAFCRYCAVYGGEYRLGFPVTRITVSKNDSCGYSFVGEDGAAIIANKIISSLDYVSALPLSSDPPLPERRLSKAIVITSKSLFSSANLALIAIPPSQTKAKKYGVYAIQQNHETHACPEGKFVLSLMSEAVSDSAKEDLGELVDQLLSMVPSGPTTRIFYQQKITAIPSDSVLCNDESIALCPNTESSIAIEDAMITARSIFSRMCPDAEFMPPVQSDQDE